MLLVCTCDHRADLVAQLLTPNARLSAGHSSILSQWKLRAAKRRETLITFKSLGFCV